MPPPFVLMYHSVCPRPAGPDRIGDPYQISVTPQRFGSQLDWLRRHGLQGVSMRSLLAAAARGSTAGLVGLTFDDGYADFATHALPLLARHGFSATAFVVAGQLGGLNDWDRDGVPRPLMDGDQVCEVHAAGVEIGSHGLHHRRLAGAGAGVLGAELRHSKEILEDLLHAPIYGFAYPYGELSGPAVAAAVRGGYDYAVATWPTGRRHRFALPRTYIGERDRALRLGAKRVRHRLVWAGSRP